MTFSEWLLVVVMSIISSVKVKSMCPDWDRRRLHASRKLSAETCSISERGEPEVSHRKRERTRSGQH